jgi:hypothetical protein
MHTEESRHFVSRLVQELSEFIRAMTADLDMEGGAASIQLIMATQQASMLSRHRFSLDGGRSWHEFVTGVQKVFEILTTVDGLDWSRHSVAGPSAGSGNKQEPP